MKRLTCEMCGSVDLVKQGGVFVCQACGCKYSVEEAKKMMIEGTVEVTGTVKVDNSAAIKNYLDMARNALSAGNQREADEYCNRIIEIDMSNWEAWFIKGKAVGWQSTLANIRTPETINAFSKALENCPEDKKKELAEQCGQELENLNNALLSLRINNFKTHPGDRDLQGLKNDIQTVLAGNVGFLMKSQIPVDALGNVVGYGNVLNSGLCDAWSVVYQDYRGDEGHPSEYDLKRLISEGDTIISAFNVTIALLGENYDDQEKNDLIIQIYENIITLQETIRDACSYTIDYRCAVETYVEDKKLTREAKAWRNNIIAECMEKIREVQVTGPQKIAEAKQKKRDQYWKEHPDEKARFEKEYEEIGRKMEDLNARIAAVDDKNAPRIDELKRERERKLPCEAEMDEQRERVRDLERQRDRCGIFKGSERKAIQSRIDTKEAPKLKALQRQVEAEKNAYHRQIDAEIWAVQSEGRALRESVAALQKRCDDIRAKLENPSLKIEPAEIQPAETQPAETQPAEDQPTRPRRRRLR